MPYLGNSGDFIQTRQREHLLNKTEKNKYAS